jgi:zinc D-Ala-D-Ala carboxypeptidase
VTVQLTPHFTAREFCVSASHPALVEPIPAELLDYARLLAVLALEPARAALGAPIRITSGYRPPPLNRAVGGSPTSQHLRAQAVDVVTADLDALMRWIVANAPRGIGQVIQYPSFVHVALVSQRYPTCSPFRRVGTALVSLTLDG